MTAGQDTAKPFDLVSSTKEWTEMIKLEHTVFALPFALSGLVLASPQLPAWNVVFWTILAFTGARAGAMTLNRLIDAKIICATRALKAGRSRKEESKAVTPASLPVFLF